MKSFWLGFVLGAGVVYYVGWWVVSALLAFFADGVVRDAQGRGAPC